MTTTPPTTPADHPTPVAGDKRLKPRPPLPEWSACTCPKVGPFAPTRPGSAIVVGHRGFCPWIAQRSAADAAWVAEHKSRGGKVDWSGTPIDEFEPTPEERAERALGRIRTTAVGPLSASFEDGVIAGYLAALKELSK